MAVQHDVAAREVGAAKTDAGDDGGEEQNSSDNKKERVVFGGTLEIQSKPLPRDVTRASLIRFFDEERESNIALIASAGGDRVTERIPRTPELNEYWQDCSHDTYGIEYLPSDGDPIFATNTTTSYRGLFFSLTTTTYNGIKTIIPSTDDNDDDSSMPKYVLNMIAEQQHPEGLPPVVWAFHKICSFCAGRDSLKPCGRAQGIMSVVEIAGDDGADGSHAEEHQKQSHYALSFSIDISIQIEFPKRLIKIMPLKKDKAEKVVSKQILKAVSKDIERNLQVFYQLFLDWYADETNEAKEVETLDGGVAKSEL